MVEKKKLLVLLVFITCHFLSAAVYALQAPFLPFEAEKKGATPSEYGVIFGIYEGTILVTAPFIGHYLSKLGVRFCQIVGLFVVSVCSFLFGYLNWVSTTGQFLVLAYILRILEGLGQGAYSLATLTTTAEIFSDSANEKLGLILGAFTLGMVISPTIGGALYTIGGFGLPFHTIASFLFFGMLLIILFGPKNVNPAVGEQNTVTSKLVKSLETWLAIYCLFCAAFSIGFLQSTLEPHLRVFNYSTFYTSLFFAINPTVEAMSRGCVGRMIDKGISPRKIMVCGAILNILAFALIGPFPFLRIRPKVYLVIMGLICFGLGLSFQISPGFGELFRISRKLGLQNNVETNGSISGIWQGSIAFGIFIGPIFGGILLQFVGFRNGSLLPVCVNLALILIVTSLLFKIKKNKVTLSEEFNNDEPLLNHLF